MLEIGKILTTHGLNGVVKLQSFCENPEDIFNYSLYNSDEKQMICKKVGLTNKNDIFLAKFDNINSIDKAKNYRNTILFSKKNESNNNSEIYINDLIGMSVTSNGKTGKIIEFSNYGAGDIVDIQWDNGKIESILFSKNIIKNFDRNKNIISIETPKYI